MGFSLNDLPVFCVEDRQEGVVVRDNLGLPCSHAEVYRLIELCHRYMASHTDAEISQAVEIILSRREVSNEEARSYPSRNTHGFVYLAWAKSLNRWKIGQSKKWVKRGSELKKQSPIPITIEFVIESGNRRELELSLHQKFADKRVHGEWFELDADDVVYIKSIGGEA